MIKKLKLILFCFLQTAIFVGFSQVQKVDLPYGMYAFTFQEDSQGKVWVGLSDGNTSGALGVFEDSILNIVSGKETLPTGSYHSSIKLLDGSIIFGGNILNTKGKSILVWVSNMGVDTLQIPFLLSNPFVNCIAIVNRRDIWIGTASGLLVNERGRWSRYTSREGLHDNFVATIFQDFRGMVWIGTEQGISYFIDGKLYQVGQGSRVISAASEFYGDNRGYVWCGSRFSSEGVSVFNGEVWETFSGRNGLVDNSASTFFQDRTGRLWIGSCYHRSRGGVSVFDGRDWKGYSADDKLAKPCVDAIIADSKDRIWFGGSLSPRHGSGITVLDGETWLTIGNNKDFPAERVISFFLDSAGQVWVSSFEGLFIVGHDYNFVTE